MYKKPDLYRILHNCGNAGVWKPCPRWFCQKCRNLFSRFNRKNATRSSVSEPYAPYRSALVAVSSKVLRAIYLDRERNSSPLIETWIRWLLPPRVLVVLELSLLFA